MRGKALIRFFDSTRYVLRFDNVVDRLRAQVLANLLFTTLPVAFINLVFLFINDTVFLFIATLSPLVAIPLLIALRRGTAPALIGIILGAYLEIAFLEGLIRTHSEVSYLWLAFVPFVGVFAAGLRVGLALLIPPLVITFSSILFPDTYPPGTSFVAHLFNSRTALDILSFGTFSFVMFGVAAAFENLARRLYRSYVSEREEVEAEIRLRKSNETELESSLALLETVFASIPMPVFVKDRDLRFTRCNAAFLEFLELPSFEVEGRTIDEILEGDISGEHLEADKRLIATGRVQCYSAKIIRKSTKEVRDVLTLKTPIKNVDGLIIGIVGVILDQTDRIEGEKRLLSLLEARRDALALLGHDLRNPIGSFRNLVHSMRQDDTVDPEEYKLVLDELGRSLDSLWSLLDELLDWARADEGLADFHPARFKAAPLASSAVDGALTRATEKGIFHEIRIPQDLEVWGDERMVSAILRNLTTNSVKFTQPGGSILISAERIESDGNHVPSGVKLIVADTGIGMSESYISALFESESLRPRRGTIGELGTGLGVKLCRRFAERHGGSMSIESVEGAGSLFSVFLPNPE